MRSPRVLERLKGVDILVCAVDDAFVPIVLNRLSVQYFIPLVSSGLMMERTEDGPVLRGQVHVTIPSVQLNMVEGNRRPTCCHACIDAFNLLQASYDAMAAVEREAALRRGYVPRRGVGPGFGVLSRTAASVISWTIQNIVAGFTGYYPRILFDLGGEHFDSGHGLPSFAYADPGLTVSEDCLVCGRSGVLGLGDEEPLRDWRPERHNYRLPRLPGLGPRR